MIDVTNLPIATVIAMAVAAVISIIKPFLEKTFLPPDAGLHDASIRLLAVVLGIAFTFFYLMDTAGKADWISALVIGFNAGLGSIGLFHLVTTDTVQMDANTTTNAAVKNLQKELDAPVSEQKKTTNVETLATKTTVPVNPSPANIPQANPAETPWTH